MHDRWSERVWLSASRVALASTLGVVVLAAGCGGGGGGGGGGGTVLTGAVITGHVEVLGAPGVGVGDVSVRLGSETTTTNEQGWYVFADVPAADVVVVTATGDGYVRASERLSVVDGAAYHVDLVMVPSGSPATVDAASGGTITLGGATLTIPAGAFVDPGGATVSGSVTVSFAALDPGGTDQSEDAFPGEFSGVESDGIESPLESFGAFAIEVRAGTTLLALAPGASIDVSVPIAPSGLATAPSTIATWSFDDTRGLWVEESSATRSGDAYETSLPHLSWWNFDSAYRDQTTCITVCFANGSDPVAGVYVHVHMPAVRAAVTRYTGSDGCVSIDVRASTEATLYYSYANGAEQTLDFTTQALVTSTRLTPSNCQDLGTLSLAPAVAQVMLTWGPEPSDLDSHMTGPADSGRFHTYYGSRGSLTVAPYCNLDTDDTSAFGPEVITVSQATSGVYRYSVHNYSGQSAHPLESSGARVVVIAPLLGQTLSFTPPPNPGNGNVWRVFDLMAEGDAIVAIVPINDFVQSPGSSGSAFDP